MLDLKKDSGTTQPTDEDKTKTQFFVNKKIMRQIFIKSTNYSKDTHSVTTFKFLLFARCNNFIMSYIFNSHYLLVVITL